MHAGHPTPVYVPTDMTDAKWIDQKNKDLYVGIVMGSYGKQSMISCIYVYTLTLIYDIKLIFKYLVYI